MREQFFKKNIIEIVLSFFLGIVIAFSSLIYILLYIYTGLRSLIIPIIILIIGLIITGWGVYKVKTLGQIIDAEEVDFGEK
ncbi:hypothetical protein HK18_10970 [Commensalibacter intestini]|uniref:Uncharacterized protein n=1 Tax=Commensalibacter intestini TaxID=479936 RepID=A0A251ZTS1_9PROT|nr:hypothetical protein [Commensalibacter intestini]OUI78058.1 hypothetical protein HK18_10970 [Commensalibacter intestini]